MTYRDVVRDIAYDRHGLVTTTEAVAAGVPSVELPKLAARGALENLSRGLYRFIDAPVGRHDGLAEAVKRVGPGAYLSHDAVLALHNLALVHPRRTRVATAERVRAKLPGWIELVRRTLPAEAITAYEGIPSTTVAQALEDCLGMVPSDRLLDAAKAARARWLLTETEYRRLRRLIRKWQKSPDRAAAGEPGGPA